MESETVHPEQEIEAKSLEQGQASQGPAIPPSLQSDIQTEVSSFQGGKIKQFSDSWEKLTSDPDILRMVRGMKLEFDCHNSELPASLVVQPRWNAQEKEVIESGIQKLSFHLFSLDRS